MGSGCCAGGGDDAMGTPFVSCRCVELHAEGVEVVRSSPDGKWVAVARTNATLEVYEVASWHLKLRLRDDGCRSIRSLLWLPLAPAAAVAAAAAAGNRGGGGEEAAAAVAAVRPPAACSLHPLLLNGSSSSTQKEDDEEQQDLLLQSDAALFDWTIVSAGLHGVITVWDLRLLQIAVETSSFGGAVFSLSAAAAGVSPRCFAAACDDGRVRLFQLEGAAGTTVAAVAAAAAAAGVTAAGLRAAKGVEVAAAATYGEAEDEEGSLAITLRATLPKTPGRLLSVCWYTPSLLFAGSANSTIYRFSASAAAATSGGSYAPVFIADGKMLLQQPRQQQQQRQPQQQANLAVTKSGPGKANPSSNANSEVLIWSLHAVPRLQLLLSGDSSGCVTVWGLPACVALQRLQLHTADVLNVEAVVIGPPPSSFSSRLPSSFPRNKSAGAGPAGFSGKQKESSCSIVVVSAGVDGKLATATNSSPETGATWVLGPARYPHRADIRGLTLLQRRWSSTPPLKHTAAAPPFAAGAAGSAADPAAAAAAAAATQGGLLATLAAVTGAVDGTVCLNEKLLGQSSAAELKKLPTPVATTPLAKGFRPRVRVAAAAAGSSATAVLFACTDEGLDIWAVDEALRSAAAAPALLRTSSLVGDNARDKLRDDEDDSVERAEYERKEKQQQVVKLLRVCLREGVHPRCGDIAPDAALLVAGSRDGLHFFGLDLQELQVFDVEGGAACSRSRGVTAVRFLSQNVICFCELYFPRKKLSGSLQKKKKAKKTRLQHLPDLLQQQQQQPDGLSGHAVGPGGSGGREAAAAADAPRTAGHQWNEDAATAAAAAAAAAAALEAAWETLFVQKSAAGGGGGGGGRSSTAAAAGEVAAFRISIVDVWTETHLGHCGPLSHPVRTFEVSADGKLLACCLTSGALLLLDVRSCLPVYFLPAFPSLNTDISCVTFLCAAPSGDSSSSKSSSSHSNRVGDSSGEVSLCLFAPSNHYTLLRLRRVRGGGQGGAAGVAASSEDPSASSSSISRCRDGTAGDAEEGGGEGISSSVPGKKRRKHAEDAAEVPAAAAAAGLWLPRLSRRIRQVPRSCLPASGGPIVSAAWLGLPLPAASVPAAAACRERQHAVRAVSTRTQQQQEGRAAEENGAAVRVGKASQQVENDLVPASLVVERKEEDAEAGEETEEHEEGTADEEEETETDGRCGLGLEKRETGKGGKRLSARTAKKSRSPGLVPAADAAVSSASVVSSTTATAQASVLYCLTASALCRLPPLPAGHLLRGRRSSGSRRRRGRPHKRCRMQRLSAAAQQPQKGKTYVDVSSCSSSEASTTGEEEGGGEGRRRSREKLQQHSSSGGSSGSSCSEEEADEREVLRWNRLSTPLSPGHCSLDTSSRLASAVAAAVRRAAVPRSFTTVCAPPLYAAATAGSSTLGNRSQEGFAAAAAALPRLPAALRPMLLHAGGLQQRGRYLLLAYQAKQLQQLLATVTRTPGGKRKRMCLQAAGQDETGAAAALRETAAERRTPRTREREATAEEQRTGETEGDTDKDEREDEMEAVVSGASAKQMTKKQQQQLTKKQVQMSYEALQGKHVDISAAATHAVEGSPQASLLSTTCSSPSSLGAAAGNGDGSEGHASSNNSNSKKKKKSQEEAVLAEDAFSAALHPEGRSGAAPAAGALDADEEAEEVAASGSAACAASEEMSSQASDNTTCASSSPASDKKRRSGSGSNKSLLHRERLQQQLQHEQKRHEQHQQQQDTQLHGLKLQQPCGSSSMEDRWHEALSRPSVIRVNAHHGFLALEMVAWPGATAGSSGRERRLSTAAEEDEYHGEEDAEEYANGRKVLLKEKKIQTHKTRINATAAAACTMPTIVLVEAFSGAVALPDNMPAPFNRKRYGT